MNYKKNNVIFSFFVFFLIGLFSIASFSALNSNKGNKGKAKGHVSVKLVSAKGAHDKKASGEAKIIYDAKKNKANMKLNVKRLPTIFPAASYTDPHFYEGWFFTKDDYVFSTGAFNTDWSDKGRSFVTFKPNNLEDDKGNSNAHNLSAIDTIKVTRERNNGNMEPSSDVALVGNFAKAFAKVNPYKSNYGSKLK
ncbi:MAG: hypothetical protein HZA77_04200 [Candidatus Schekmanbacteria bacterium]|nr:hypothetical protein [Candidatus Schekmanbacteria bacterium]